VPVPVFCLFFVSQKIHIKRSPNAIKFYGELFLNICDFWEVESMQTEAHSLHKANGHDPPGRMVLPCEHTVSRLGSFFGRKEAYIEKKNLVKISAQS
jgi:hypothetical protein